MVDPRSDENSSETLTSTAVPTFTDYRQGLKLKCNDGNIDTHDDMGDLWTEGMAYRGLVLEYLGIGPAIDEVLNEAG